MREPRELENIIERGVILGSPGEPVDVGLLFVAPPGLAPVTVNAQGQLERSTPADAASLYDEIQRRGLSLDALEDALLKEAVERAGGNLAAAARALGISRAQLSYRIDRAHERSRR